MGASGRNRSRCRTRARTKRPSTASITGASDGGSSVTVAQFRQFIQATPTTDRRRRLDQAGLRSEPTSIRRRRHLERRQRVLQVVEQKKARVYRCPTDAGEYCCRAGSTTAARPGDDPSPTEIRMVPAPNTAGDASVGKLPPMPGASMTCRTCLAVGRNWYTDYYKNSPLKIRRGRHRFKMGDKPPRSCAWQLGPGCNRLPQRCRGKARGLQDAARGLPRGLR